MATTNTVDVDILDLVSSLPLDCPCNGPELCRPDCYHRTSIGRCDKCEGWGTITQTIVNAAYAKGYAARRQEQEGTTSDD